MNISLIITKVRLTIGTFFLLGALALAPNFALAQQTNTSWNTGTPDAAPAGNSQTTGSGCRIDSFTTPQNSITQGDSAALSWMTSGCESVAITSPNGGQWIGLPLSGSQQTSALAATTTYTLAARSAAMTTVNRSITITVSSSQNQQTNSTGGCVINSFSSSPSIVNPGDTATLNWDTTGCTSLTISGGSLTSYQFAPTGSVLATNLSRTTTFSLYANGTTSSSKTTTVSVTGGSGAYVFACSDGVDNDGDGRIDFPADSDCTSSSDNSESSSGTGTAPSNAIEVFTTVATNVGPSTARLNGLVNSTVNNIPVTFFQYGTTRTVDTDTTYQYISAGQSVNFYQTIPVRPSTTYYWRAVAKSDTNVIYRGSINSFTTPAETNSGNIFSFIGSGSNDKTSGTGASTTDGVTVTIKNKSDNIGTGDTIEYTIDYHNGSGMTLTNATLVVSLPTGFTLKQGTKGQIVSPTTFQATLGTIATGTDGELFVEATVDRNVARNETLVTNATLNFTLPNNKQDSAVGYVLNHVNQSSAIGGLAIGAGFFPTTIFGWFMTILVILILILVVRRIVRGKQAGHGGGHGGGHH